MGRFLRGFGLLVFCVALASSASAENQRPLESQKSESGSGFCGSTVDAYSSEPLYSDSCSLDPDGHNESREGSEYPSSTSDIFWDFEACLDYYSDVPGVDDVELCVNEVHDPFSYIPEGAAALLN